MTLAMQAIFFEAANNHLGHQLAVATHQKFAIGENALVFTNVQYDKIPFRINCQNFTLEVGAQHDIWIGSNQCVKLRPKPVARVQQNSLLRVQRIHRVLHVFQVATQLGDLGRRQTRIFVGGQFVLRRIPFLRGLGQLVG